MVRDGIGPPRPAMLPLRLTSASSNALCLSFCLRRKQKYIIAETMATRATSPIVSPTAPPVPSPFLELFSLTGATFWEFGGTVGVTVTVCTSPVIVSRETTGVGVQVEDVEDVEDVESFVVGGAVVVADVGVFDEVY